MAEKITIIYPGVSTKFIRALEDAHKPDHIRDHFGIGDRPCLLSVGRLALRKGIHPFVRYCLPLIIQEVPDCVFMIVGDDPEGALVHRGGEMALVREAVAELGVEDHVLFAGKVTDAGLIGIYRAADLFVFPVLDIPNDVEGFGMVAIEAALVGRTSVGSNVGGIPDAIEDHVSGLLVPPGDYRVFADKVIQLLKDSDLREGLEEKARERVLTKLSWDTIINDWNDLITQTTGK